MTSASSIGGVLEGRRTFGNIMKYVMMGTSSNFGNMFSMARGDAHPSVPADAPGADPGEQLPLRHLGVPDPLDSVDPRILDRPRRWDMSAIRNFMLVVGPVSSVFDFLTFYVHAPCVPRGGGLVPHRMVRGVARHAGAGHLRDPDPWKPAEIEAHAVLTATSLAVVGPP